MGTGDDSSSAELEVAAIDEQIREMISRRDALMSRARQHDQPSELRQHHRFRNESFPQYRRPPGIDDEAGDRLQSAPPGAVTQ